MQAFWQLVHHWLVVLVSGASLLCNSSDKKDDTLGMIHHCLPKSFV